ncbi:hypothetical protein TGCAST_216230 [Toxoplasma gondii CAST]|uniref:Uncharacterized protein n=1 Tax=Toxoplasma gondii CAST TaxID=943122 RepID=A0A425HN06_TOXGO|nr:hypothetical protein TGCAST_216230 [Toxoplasma gondii CAST]
MDTEGGTRQSDAVEDRRRRQENAEVPTAVVGDREEENGRDARPREKNRKGVCRRTETEICVFVVGLREPSSTARLEFLSAGLAVPRVSLQRLLATASLVSRPLFPCCGSKETLFDGFGESLEMRVGRQSPGASSFLSRLKTV